ncbi:para-aminobenzoate synthetase / 4-amino-4-deoxychorismate lyase [Caldimonas brevitalea]|uniref:Para-aminobenzoate synthetase / 4-amino-4-deoxychorismate lyase n=1 Tax=Caldimonas brevitalea TaxID=413882 RepID=A0A0G3BQ00_9BURK|nr:para-aminobenzoate synthetase / 4-amino-4-deoxychorismate lyase [Caldimonas brevitalea]
MSAGQFAILDNNRQGKTGTTYVFSNPLMYCTAHTPEQVEHQLAEIETQTQRGRHVAGYFSYELGYALNARLQTKLPKHRELPLFCVGVYQDRLEIDDGLFEEALSTLENQTDLHIIDCRLNMSREQYLEQIGKVKQHIHDGDTYQVNYTLKYKFRHTGSPLRLYAELRRRQRVEYGAFLDFPGVSILSRSPELFVHKTGEDIYTKPMKGTCKRGATPEQDRMNFEFLSSDEKSRAENVMIVDLLRNDFSRISQRASVKTTNLFEVQTYETLHQMVSTVSAKVDPRLGLARLLKQIFPCGSITGAPKIRTMEIIRDLEVEPRGVYTGAIGFASPDHALCLNVPIRTLALWPDGRGEMGVGSGVVHDSDPEAEYEECELKGRFFTRGFADFDLIECLLFDQEYRHLDKHLARLKQSAAELGFPVDVTQLRAALLSEPATLPPEPVKVRVVLMKSGEFRIECVPLGPSDTTTKKITVSADTVTSSRNRLLAHKTSARAAYKDAYDRCSRDGYYDVIFLNELNQVTEGSFNNLFIRKDGVWYTPPVSCGLLPGIQRQCLLESSDIDAREKILTLSDLHDADEIFLVNAIRGVKKVELDHPAKAAP